MKFLTFVDLHEDKKGLQELVKRASKPDIDFVICAGDISTFGRGIRIVFRQFNDLGKKMYVIPGNHEEREGLLDAAVQGFPNVVNFHQGMFTIDGYIFLGYGGGGFTMEDSSFRKIARQWYGEYNGEKIILVTHGPPFQTKLDLLHNQHVGNKDYRAFIERISPRVAISGHLHETAGAMDKIGATKLVNPGWEGMVIELR